MTRKNNWLIGLALSLAVFAVYIPRAMAAGSASVATTVTVQNISVSLNKASIDYGTLGSNSSSAYNSLNTITASNSGNIVEKLSINGANTANWTLALTAGTDQYVHRFCTATCGTPPTNYTALTTSYQTLVASLAIGATQTFDLNISTPNPSTVFTLQTATVTVMASL